MERLKKIILVAGALLAPAIALAAAGDIIPTKPGALPGGPGSRFSLELLQIINLFLGIVGLIAVAYLIYGGFRYMTSAGNEETTEQAKKIIVNSIIGLVVIILSYIIVVTISNALIFSNV